MKPIDLHTVEAKVLTAPISGDAFLMVDPHFPLPRQNMAVKAEVNYQLACRLTKISPMSRDAPKEID